MTPKPVQNASAEYLRWAQPRLICRVEPEGRWRLNDAQDQCCKLTHYISCEIERGWDEVLSEGYDPDGSPPSPVYSAHTSTEATSGCIAAPFSWKVI